MNKTLALLKAGFVSSSGKTPEFTSFVSVFKKEFKKELTSVGATNLQFNVGHFYISGFYTIETQIYYFCLDDVRWNAGDSIYYRTAKDYKDYTGGCNKYTTLQNGMAQRMHKGN